MPRSRSSKKWPSGPVVTEIVDIMTNQEMFDNVMGQLEGSARGAVELTLAADSRLAARSARLKTAIDLLVDDGSDIEPPIGLARSTIFAVAALAKSEMPVRRRKRFSELLPTSIPFRWADIAVAATIFVAGVLTLIPAIQRSRDRMNQAGCTFNLKEIGQGLLQYRDRYDAYPYLTPESPASHAGSYALILHDAGFLNDSRHLYCPCFQHTGSREHAPMPNLQTACLLKTENPERFQSAIAGDYAYQVGLRTPGSPWMNVALQIASTTALLADQPPHDGHQTILEGNSPNHRSMGQNVLFGDGHSQWYRTRRLNPYDSDMFLNHHDRPGPSSDDEDSVLVPPPFPFHGSRD